MRLGSKRRVLAQYPSRRAGQSLSKAGIYLEGKGGLCMVLGEGEACWDLQAEHRGCSRETKEELGTLRRSCQVRSSGLRGDWGQMQP